jgi:hypothetical protein
MIKFILSQYPKTLPNQNYRVRIIIGDEKIKKKKKKKKKKRRRRSNEGEKKQT